MNDARIERVARALCSVDGLDPDRPGAPPTAKRFIAALDAAIGHSP